jgi:hypothetical protein
VSQCVGRLCRLEATGEPEGLNIAEIELATLTRQCLERRIPDLPTLQAELNAWNTQRNNLHSTINWHFTTTEARIKLKRLYPVIDD